MQWPKSLATTGARVAAVVAFALFPVVATAVTMTEGTNRVASTNFEIDFSDGGATVDRVDSLKWSPLGNPGAATSPLANGRPGGCGGNQDFWGQSYADADFQLPNPVVAGSAGTWRPSGARSLTLDSAAPTPCTGDSVVIPVRTRYTFFDSGGAANMFRVERRFGFDASSPAYMNSAQGFRAYVPRLPSSTYTQVLYPNAAGSALITGSPFCGICFSSDWNGTWLALHHPTSGGADVARGVVILRDPANTSPARVVLDTDGASASNLSSVTLTKPSGGWKSPVTETEYVCFYDASTWTPSAGSLPPGCVPTVVPINTAAPQVSGPAGNPRPGDQLTAVPGSWDYASGAFTYQWSRCNSIGTCQAIPSATDSTYTATPADTGLALKVAVTATAAGGETDTAASNPAGSISGTVYGSVVSPATVLAGAQVMACRTTQLQGCRTAVTDANGVYRLQVPVSGDYELTAYPPPGSSAVAGARASLTTVVDGAETANQNILLRAPGPPPPSVSISGSGYRGNSGAGGVATIHWQQPVVIRVRVLDIDWDVVGQITFPDGSPPIPLLPTGPPTPDPTPGFPDGGYWDFEVPPTYPNHGPGEIKFDFTPDPSDPDPTDPDPETPAVEPPDDPTFPIYIDPSGYVRDLNGNGLAGVTVTLSHADTENGPFTDVPDGDAIMSPMNRTNPDTTDPDGHFGWDVLEGFYKVRVQKAGCHAPGNATQAFVETAAYAIPPPVTDLDIRLDCAPTTPPGPLVLTLEPKTRAVRASADGVYTLTTSQLNCPTGSAACDVVLTPRAKAGKKQLNLGTSTQSVSAGSSGALAGQLSAEGLKMLKKRKRVKTTIEVMASQPGAEPVGGVVKAKLLAPKRKEGR